MIKINRKNYILSILILVIFTILLSYDLSSLTYKFLELRSDQDKKGMETFIKSLESLGSDKIDILILLAESYLEYGSWGVEERYKKDYFVKSYELSKDVIKKDPNNGKAYFIAGVSLSKLMNYMNIFQKVSRLSEFDNLMSKALELIEDKIYKGLTLLGLGVRYMAPPWPFGDLNKAEKYFLEAEKYISDYSGLYLQMGYLYLKMGRKDIAKKYFERVLSMNTHPLFKKAHEENVSQAKEELKKIK